MSKYNEDTRGRRLKWAREQKGLTQPELGALLRTTANPNGVRHVYISQLENDKAGDPSLPLLQKWAEVTGVTVGWLLLETDYPYSGKAIEPVYFSPEADEVAQLIDAAPPEERARIVAVVRALAGPFAPETKPRDSERVIYLPKLTHRLIYGEEAPQARREQSR